MERSLNGGNYASLNSDLFDCNFFYNISSGKNALFFTNTLLKTIKKDIVILI